jgi:hypothetical protein
LALPSNVEQDQESDGVRALKRSLASFLARFLNWAMNWSLVPVMKWCASYIDPPTPAAPAKPYTSTEDSPINMLLLNAASRETINDPHLQRDLNACMESLHGHIGDEFQLMFAHLMSHFAPAEVLIRVLANAIFLGYTAGLMVQRAEYPNPSSTEERNANV